jgi:hypothetical protein
MNKIFNILFLLALSFGAAQTLNAQAAGTDDDGFVLQITSPANIAQDLYNGQPCGWEGSTYGPSLTADQAFCGQAVWGKDSLGCTPLTNAAQVAGKIVLLRRGICNFSLKVYNAQAAGAIACVMITHYSNAAEGPCTLSLGGMSGGDSATAVTIPNVIIHRQTGEQIDAAIAAGLPVEMCFSFPRMLSPTSASMYATPVSQVAPMNAMTVLYNNRSGATESDVVLKAEVFDPSGALHGSTTYTMPVVEPGVDSFAVFPEYDAPALKGKWTVRYTNNKYNQALDTVYSYFEHTDYTFATDNLVVDPGGVGPSDADFATNGFYIQSGGLVLTGDNPAKATHATFSVGNFEAVYVPGDPSANIIGVAVYKGDVDGDGAGDLSASFIDDLGAGLISYNEYVMDGTEVNDVMIHVPLTDINTGDAGIDLEAGQGYYVSLIYDGTAAGLGVCPRFSNSLDVAYAAFTGYPTTPLYFGQLFGGGWSGAMVIQRLQLEGFDPTISTKEPNVLADSKLNITPNPANEFVNLELKLDEVNPSVAVSILDAQGRLAVATQVEKNIQNGVIRLDVNTLPSGTYFMWVRTAEGSTMKKVSVCH